MSPKLSLALAGILAFSVSNVFADDDQKKPKKPSAPSDLIISQSEDEPRKPTKPKEDTQLQQIVAQSEPKKPEKPEGPDLQS
jgi:hypothetical protein